MANKTTLEMQFLTDLSKKVHINVPDPVQPTNNADVDSAMALIVAKNIFALPQGNIVKGIGAQLVQSDATSVG